MTLPRQPVLTHAVARRIIEAGEAKSAAAGWKMHFTIVDAGGNLLAYSRMDGSILVSQEVSRMKAMASVKLGGPSEAAAAFAFTDKGPSPFAFLPGVMMIPGGLPIYAAGTLVGAIGVSGDSAENDKAAAQAGLDAVAAELA